MISHSFQPRISISARLMGRTGAMPRRAAQYFLWVWSMDLSARFVWVCCCACFRLRMGPRYRPFGPIRVAGRLCLWHTAAHWGVLCPTDNTHAPKKRIILSYARWHGIAKCIETIVSVGSDFLLNRKFGCIKVRLCSMCEVRHKKAP